MSDENKTIIQTTPVLQANSVQKNSTLTQDINFEKRHGSNKGLHWIIGIVALVIIILLGWNFYTQYKLKKIENQLHAQQADPQAESKKQSQELVDKVGQLIVLPKDEEPTIATVSDLDKLAGQAFFANAQLGDKVLIYYGAKKAILYRPSDNKIIELAPLVNNELSAPTATTPATTPATPVQ